MLHFDTRGNGSEPLVLLHGFLGSGRNLSSLARRLADTDASRQVFMVDLPGHGHSPPLEADASLDFLATQIGAFIKQVSRGQRIPVVGHSLGGRVLLRLMAQKCPELGQAILLDISPDALPSLDGPMQRLFERLMGAPASAADRAEMRQFFVSGGVDSGLTDWILTNLEVESQRVRWRIDRAGLARLHWQETGLSLWEGIPAHAASIALIAGGNSHFVSKEAFARFEKAGVQTDVIAGAGHFLHVDALDALVAALNCSFSTQGS